VAAGQTSGLSISGAALYSEGARGFPVTVEAGLFEVAGVGFEEDLNGDGTVNEVDLLRLIAAWHGQLPPAEGDADGDGDTDPNDVMKVAAAWRVSRALPTAPPTAPPAPTPTATRTPGPTAPPSPAPPTTTPAPPTATPVGTVYPEQEPNDSPQSPQSLGNLNIGDSFRVTGRLTSGGASGNQYTGDLDYYSIVLPVQSNIAFSLDWSGGADVDLGVAISGEFIVTATGSEKPITLAGPLSEGNFILMIVSKNDSADYEFTIQASQSTAEYPNDNALLNGKYQAETIDPVFQMWYEFDGAGGYEYWNWSFPSGDVLMHNGAYRIWYPYIIFEHAGDGEVEIYDFELELNPPGPADAMYLDGSRYGRV